MTRCAPGLLLVRPAVPAEAGRLRVGVAEVYVLVEVDAAAGAPPLASCRVMRVDETAAQVDEPTVGRAHRGCGHDRRLLADVWDVLRAAGVRSLTHRDGRVVEL